LKGRWGLMKVRLVSIAMICILLLSVVSPVYAGEEVFANIVGQWQGKKNNLDFAYPFKGDIYFGGNTGGKYGKYTHVALARTMTDISGYTFTYGGDAKNPQQTVSGNGWTGMTIESTTTTNADDVVSRSIQRFWFYDWAAEGYVNNATDTIRSNAVNKALSYSGGYDWNALYSNNTSWNCTKLVTRAYDDVSNVLLGDIEGQLGFPTIMPDNIFYDSNVTIYTTSSAVSELSLPQHAIERQEKWKEKGVKLNDIQFQNGIHKEGFSEFLLRMHEESNDKKAFKEKIKKEYKIDDEQYMQILNDGKESTL
jgi:hypothetical protein